jgi:excisionase family DNA binding protein
MQDEMLTVRQAAEMLGIRLDYAYRLVGNRQIAAAQINGEWRIPRSAVQKHLLKKRVQNYRARLAVAGA